MPFKEDVTQNIYNSWMSVIFNAEPGQLNDIRQLHSFSVEELNHLKWLIEQEIEGRNAKVNT